MSSALDAAVIREAAQWLVRMHAGQASAADAEACRRWRAASPAHEQAWQKAERLRRQFGAVPPALGVPVLTRPAPARRRAAVKAMAVLGLAAPVSWLAWRQAGEAGWGADYRTAVGERREVALADGSRVLLNTATALDVAFTAQARRLHLRRGEIDVRTAADRQSPARPFEVHTAQGRLLALGTRFVVRVHDDGWTELAVLAHRVQITTAGSGAQRVLEAGQRVRFSAGVIEAAQPLAAGWAAAGAPAWAQGVLYADDQRLGDFLAELARYRPGLLRCDPAVAGLRISGAFQLADTDAVLAALQAALPIEVVRRTRYWVTVVARAPVT
ncbi:MAG: Protein FecR [Paracidovorax wautersii]|uniref:Protein FecR n=1 Tax=Paracidovorax wautersii TaxID=1177982 RepID=A0A7V8FSG1_9BURK|nr:MAG: Protein FecR [Paracidovorax wautersii]